MENAQVVKDLLAELCERGILTNRTMLFVLDGSRAPASGVKEVRARQVTGQRRQGHPPAAKAADALMVTSLSADRRTIETAFGHFTQDLRCEINTPGDLTAALFGFCVALFGFCMALLAYNVALLVKAGVCGRGCPPGPRSSPGPRCVGCAGQPVTIIAPNPPDTATRPLR